MSNLKERYKEVTRHQSFEYTMYEDGTPTHDVFISVSDDYITGVKITFSDASYDKDQMFVFDVNNERHLKMAADIYEKLCELKESEKTPQPARVTKVSGKLV